MPVDGLEVGAVGQYPQSARVYNTRLKIVFSCSGVVHFMAMNEANLALFMNNAPSDAFASSTLGPGENHIIEFFVPATTPWFVAIYNMEPKKCVGVYWQAYIA